MIETIRKFGQLVLQETNLVEALTRPVVINRQGKKQHVIEIDLQTEKGNFFIHPPYEVDKSTSTKFLWIGSADGASSPQWYATSANPTYLINQTLVNLLKKWDENDPYYKKLQNAFKTFFIDLKIGKQNELRYRYLIDPKYYGTVLTKTFNLKDTVKEATKGFNDYLKQNYGLTPNEIQLYTLSIDGERIVDQPHYRELIIKEKDLVFEKAKNGVCSVTGEEAIVTSDTSRLKFNYYITDKINFANNIEKKGYTKNLVLSKRTYHQLMAGEAFIFRQFNTRFSDMNCFIIPELLFVQDDDVGYKLSLNEWSEKIKAFIFTAKTDVIFTTLQDKLDDFLDDDDLNSVTLHFLFYTQIQASLKVNMLIQHVPIVHINKLIKYQFEAERLAKYFHGTKNHWSLKLDNIYYLIPMRIQGGNTQEKKKILTVYEALLLGKKISYSWLINQFTQLAKIYYFSQENIYQFTKANDSDFKIRESILKGQWLIWLLRKLTMYKEGEDVVDLIYELDDSKLIEYMKEMQFKEAESALFLLGNLIGEVARIQYLDQKKKPILNKINYQGMNRRKVEMLSTDVFEKLVQLQKTKVSFQQEKLFSEHKRLFDLAIKNWKLSDKEAVFYILSGYAFKTQQILLNVKEKEEVSNE